MKPETLIEASQQTENLRSIMDSMSTRYLEAVCSGRVDKWAQAMHAIINCFDENIQIKRVDVKDKK
jgi:hypothetical protein